MKPKILVTRKIMNSAEVRLKKKFDVFLNEKDIPIKYEDLVKVANQYDGIICSGWDKLDKNFFNQLNNKLQIIAGIGIGYDNIDVESAKNKKIIVTNSPNKSNDAVAEITIFLLIGAARKAYEGVKIVKSDLWKEKKIDWTNFMLGHSLANKTLGIIGMGRIGRVVAKRAKAFGMKIIYFNRNKLSSELEGSAKYYGSVDEMMPHCDFVSINCPSSPETIKIMSAKAISLLPLHAVIVNTSRGNTIDEEALLGALENNKIHGAGLDVFNNEPNIDKRFFNLDNCFTLPHIGSADFITREAMSLQAVENIEAHFSKSAYPSRVI
jgi:glyoxylate reductase